MASTFIDIEGMRRVRNGLRRLAADQPEIVDPVMDDWSKEVRVELKATKYPPKRPKQTYVRTGRIANSFRREKVKTAVYSLRNTAPYSSFVLGDSKGDGQAWMHVGRWWIMREEVEKRIPRLTEEMTKVMVDFDGA